jgi:catalase
LFSVPLHDGIVSILNQIDGQLAGRVAAGLGIEGSKDPVKPLNQSLPADGDIAEFQPRNGRRTVKPSPELSIVLSGRKDSVRTRKIAILAADGCDDRDLNTILQTCTEQGLQAKIVAPRLGHMRTAQGHTVKIHFSFLTASSVMFDALYVPGGQQSVEVLKRDPAVLEFVYEAYKHAKALAASGSGTRLLRAANVLNGEDDAVIVSDQPASTELASKFVVAVGKHRNWQREKALRVDLQPVHSKPRRSA